MTDHHSGRRLSAYLDGALTTRQAAAVARHLAACPACASELATLRAAKAALGSLPGADPGPGWLPAVTARMAAGQAPPIRLSYRTRHATRRRAAIALASTASLALAVLLAPPPPAPVSFRQEVGQHLVLIDEPAADQSSYVVEAPQP
jgi:anti-sigma factor RsiW